MKPTGMCCISQPRCWAAFFCINREGKLEFRQVWEHAGDEILQKHRFSSSFSDFVTRYTAVSSTNLRTQTAEYYALEEDDGLTMNLGINPLLQFGLEETREELCRNILTALSVVNYVPFDSDTIGNPALDLGDVLTFSGGQADSQQITCVTSFTVKIGGRQSLKCVGKNPRLSQAKSKNDKNISGLLNRIEAGKIGIHTFTNASAYTLGETNVRIISIEFASKKKTTHSFSGRWWWMQRLIWWNERQMPAARLWYRFRHLLPGARMAAQTLLRMEVPIHPRIHPHRQTLRIFL